MAKIKWPIPWSYETSGTGIVVKSSDGDNVLFIYQEHKTAVALAGAIVEQAAVLMTAKQPAPWQAAPLKFQRGERQHEAPGSCGVGDLAGAIA